MEVIKKPNGEDVVAGDLEAGAMYQATKNEAGETIIDTDAMLTNDEYEFLMQSDYIEGEKFVLEGQKAHIDAWLFVRGLEKLHLKDILKCHAILMRSKHIPDEDKGVLTRHQTWVGDRKNPAPHKVSRLICDWIRKINTTLCTEPREGLNLMTKAYHVKLMKIHPFVDGNGRVGRILYNWHRRKMGLPIHIIWEDECGDYYEWFRK